MKKGKFDTFEEAYKSVAGTRVSIVNKYIPFIETGFDKTDLFAVADEAILKAWKDWKPNESKFNTYVYNRITWSLQDFLNEMNQRFKINSCTVYELTQEGETFKHIKEQGLTTNTVFNELHELNGDSSKIDRKLYNAYVNFQTSLRRPYTVITASQFSSADSEDFDILDHSQDTEERSLLDCTFEFDGFAMDRIEMEDELQKLDGDRKRIAELILEGLTISEIANEMDISKIQLLQKFAGETSNEKSKRNTSKRSKREELRQKALAKKRLRQTQNS